MPKTQQITIVNAKPEHYQQILALNHQLVHFLSPLNLEKLTTLANNSAIFKVAMLDDEVVAFMIVFKEGADYDSVNYQWFSQKYDQFLYIDRIVVAPSTSGMGLGKRLYHDLFESARLAGIDKFTAEINTIPENPVSLNFHLALGFVEVAKQTIDNGKKEVSMQLKVLDENGLLTQTNIQSKVKEQYATSGGLNIRKALHRKYSRHNESYDQWIKARIELNPEDKILEVGCGEGKFFDNIQIADHNITQLDYTEHMVATVKTHYPKRHVLQGDVQALPFADHSFDAVFAIAMLYHVPDVMKGLKEIARVLKPGGTLYASTHGEDGFLGYIINHLTKFSGHSIPKPSPVFTMENGTEKLQQYFEKVDAYRHDSRLVIDNVADLVDYILSLESVKSERIDKKHLIDYFENKKKNGVIDIQKGYGMFIAQK